MSVLWQRAHRMSVLWQRAHRMSVLWQRRHCQIVCCVVRAAGCHYPALQRVWQAAVLPGGTKNSSWLLTIVAASQIVHCVSARGVHWMCRVPSMQAEGGAHGRHGSSVKSLEGDQNLPRAHSRTHCPVVVATNSLPMASRGGGYNAASLCRARCWARTARSRL
eukprot:3605525-Rhodomonas_salina.1